MAKLDFMQQVPPDVLQGFLKPHHEGCVLLLTVKPNASKERLMVSTSGELTLYVRAQAVENAANERVVLLLAQVFQLPKTAVSIIAGSTSRKKRVYLLGL